MSDGAPAATQLRSLAEAPPLSAYLADLWRRREFMWSLASGHLKGQHIDMWLGNVWHVLNPLLLMGVYYLVFGIILPTSRGVENFFGWLAVGVFTFGLMQRTIQACGNSIQNNIGLVRSLQFPRALLPISTTITETLAYASSFAVMLALALITGERPSASWLLAPVVVALTVMFSAGMGLVVARLTDQVRDVANVLPFFFRIAIYLSGIIFSIRTFVDSAAIHAVFGTGVSAETIRELMVLNPFFTYVELLRHVLMSSYSAEHVGIVWTGAVVEAVVALLFGMFYFRGAEKRYGRG